MSPSKDTSVDFAKFYNIVNGEKRDSDEKHHGVNPVTGEELWSVPIANKQDVDDAVKCARSAFKTWSKVPIEERKDKMRQYGDLLESYEEDMINLLCKETGKPRLGGITEVKGAKAFNDWHVGVDIPEERMEDEQKVITTRYTPIGVVGAICPWNFPMVLSIGKIAPAVLSGCCIIVKPSPFTPYTALKAIEIAQQIFPPGVVQVLGGDDKLGPMLTTHPAIDKISFTGSIATGKKIAEACAKTLKRVTLELGGNDASIILPDVDIEKVAPEVAMGAFQNSGQVCVATKRIYVHEDIYKPFVEAMVKFTDSLKVGASDEEGVKLGPIQNAMQFEKVKDFFADSKEKGYTFVAGSPDIKKTNGYFIQPTIIDNPPNDSRIITEEPFGPIVPVQPWNDEAEVIERANNTNTGLGACVWGKDVDHAERIGMQLEAGSVWINSYEKPTPQALFGGVKESGIGGEWGPKGVLAYCNAHVMHTYKQKL